VSERTETPRDGPRTDEPQTSDEPTVTGTERTFDPEADEPASTVLITAFAELTGQDPEAMERPLQDCVDAEALDALVGSAPGSDGVEKVRFTIDGYEVVVRSEGTVSIVAD